MLQHPAVQDVAVIGLPDEDGGEVPLAYIVKKPNQEVSAHDIMSFVEGLCWYKLKYSIQLNTGSSVSKQI